MFEIFEHVKNSYKKTSEGAMKAMCWVYMVFGWGVHCSYVQFKFRSSMDSMGSRRMDGRMGILLQKNKEKKTKHKNKYFSFNQCKEIFLPYP